MSVYLSAAKEAIDKIKPSCPTNIASDHATVAIALALIAIAEELEKMNSDEVKNVRDRSWLYK
jgi:hypothetical protein